MTEQAVRRTYREFLERMTDQMLEVVAEEFGGGLLGGLARSGAKRVTQGIQEEMQQQGRIVVDYSAALADGSADHSRYEREFLRTNPVYNRYDGDRKAQLERELREHFRQVAEDLSPLVASPKEDFWEAMHEEYSRDEATALVDRHFSQAETFEEYRDGVFSSARLGDRVIDVIRTGEQRLRRQIHEEVRRVYEE